MYWISQWICEVVYTHEDTHMFLHFIVCMHIYIYIYTHAHTYIFQHSIVWVYIYMYTHTCFSTVFCACIYIYIYIHTPTHTHMFQYSIVCMHIYIYIYIHQVNKNCEYPKNECYLIQNIHAEQNIYFCFKKKKFRNSILFPYIYIYIYTCMHIHKYHISWQWIFFLK